MFISNSLHEVSNPRPIISVNYSEAYLSLSIRNLRRGLWQRLNRRMFWKCWKELISLLTFTAQHHLFRNWMTVNAEDTKWIFNLTIFVGYQVLEFWNWMWLHPLSIEFDMTILQIQYKPFWHSYLNQVVFEYHILVFQRKRRFINVSIKKILVSCLQSNYAKYLFFSPDYGKAKRKGYDTDTLLIYLWMYDVITYVI